MRHFRHLTALMLGLLLLQATLLGSGTVCPRAGVAGAVDGRSDVAAVHAGHDGHGAAATRSPGDHRHDAPDSQHDAPLHCVTVMSCGIVGVASAAATLPGIAAAHTSRIAVRDDVAPASPRGAPEPPPPRG